MEKRTLIAIAISFAVLAFYPLVLEKFYPNYKPYSKTAVTPPAATAPGSQGSVSQNQAVSSQSVLTNEALLIEDDVEFENQKIKLLFNQKSGSIRDISFLTFQDLDTKRPVKFLSLETLGNNVTAFNVSNGFLVGGPTSYRIKKSDKQIVADGEMGGKLKISKEYSFSDSGYDGLLRLTLENTTGEPIQLNYKLVAGSGVMPRHSIDSQYIETNFFSNINDKPSVKHIKGVKLGKSVQSEVPVQWVAVKDRHFSIIVKPKADLTYTGLTEGLGHDNLSASLISSSFTIPAHSKIQHDFLVYIGPNDINELAPLGLDAIVNFGKLDWIGKLLVGALELLQKIFRNYGLAIIALTTLINLLFFPLTRVSFMSMKRMQLIQPQMNKLKEHHKKSPEKLNKEMMELYKKHKVNPFGGCLPMILQMPVFIALYVALSKSVILVNSKLLWIKDLSSPDSVYFPFTLPFLGNQIHVLPLIMVVAMALQQKFTQIKMDSQDPAMVMQQKMMAVMMPLLFGFIFYSMPSGLVLYWLTNTILMTLYQLHLKKVTL